MGGLLLRVLKALNSAITLAIQKLDNTLEAFTTTKPFKSINLMWHPERKNGAKIKSLDLIKNFLF